MPGMPTDPPLVLDIDGVEYAVEHAHASWWISRLSTADWYALAVDAVPALLDRMWDSADSFDLDDLAQVATTLTEQVTGLPWPRAVRLAAQADSAWPQLETWAAANASGLDLLTAPPRRTLAAVQAVLLATCEKQQDADRLMRQLDDPNGVPGITRTKRREAFAMSAAEAAAMQDGMPALAPKKGVR